MALGILPLVLCLGLGSSQLGLYVRVCWEQQELPRRYFTWHPRVVLRMSANWDDPFLLHHSSNSCFFPFPSKGYVYLVFESEKSVRALLQACSQDLLSPDGLSEYYFKMSSRRMRCKEVSRAVRAA